MRVFVAASILALWSLALVAGEAALNVNTASKEELLKLPGMNEARATAVVHYRKANGELIQLEELTLIPQIVPIYEDLRNRLTVE